MNQNNVDPHYAERDQQLKEEEQMGLNSLRGLCADMRTLQARKESLEEQLKATNDALDLLRLRQIPDMMERLGCKTATFPGIGRVQLAGDLHCSTVTGQKDAAMQWLRDCGYGDMISETYNSSSMKALVRRLIEEGAEVPACLNVNPFIRASIVKA